MRKYAILLVLASMFINSNNLWAEDPRYGVNVFTDFSQVGFESGNYRLDPDFTLGVGDSVQINLWGKLEAKYELTIGRDGHIVIPLIGKVSMLGLTLEKAREAIQSEIDKKYTNVSFDLGLVNVQDIRVEVLGNVSKPGVYAVSPFTRVVDVVAKAGGPSATGSLIDIQLKRGQEILAHFDFYDFSNKADQSQNIRLKHNDVIFIPSIKNVITIQGELQHPGTYEMNDDASLKDAIEIAGGLKKTALNKKIYLRRLDINTKKKVVLKEIVVDALESIKEGDNINLKDNDQVIITTNFDFVPCEEEFFKSISIKGEVQIPGEYLIKEGESLLEMLKKAGGLKETAFVEGAIFTRQSVKEQQQSMLEEMIRAEKITLLEQEALLAGALVPQEIKELRQAALESRKKAIDLLAAQTPQGRIVFDLKEILAGTNGKFILERNDTLFIPSRPDWVLVTGEVYNAQAIAYKNDKSMDYYVDIVGGLKKTADREGMYVIKATGRSESKATGFGVISSGDIIIVPRKSDK